MENSEASISKLTVKEAVNVFEKLGWCMEEEWIRKDIEDGAPVNKDGSLNLLQYAAWILREMGKNED